MAIISIANLYSVPKARPASYKAKDAPYAVGGNSGAYIALRPRPYPKTAQQKKAAERASTCGIKKGVTKADVMKGMKCIKYLAQGKPEKEAKEMAGVTK